MSLENYIRAMPKVELHVQLEGAWKKETLLMLAEEYEIRASTKHFDQWVKLLDNPDYSRLDDLIRMISGWLSYPEDLTRLVYDLGVGLHKQGVRYAEVHVNTALYAHFGIPYETLMAALNDGRDRVRRGWGVQMNWVLNTPRNEPRRGDEIVRFATSVSGKRAAIVGVGLVGKDASQPVGQFERIFKAAEKKDVARIPTLSDTTNAEALVEYLRVLSPTRMNESWIAADAPDALSALNEHETPLVLCMARALCMGERESYAAYPLRALLDADVNVLLSASMPSAYKSGLADEYVAAVEHAGVSVEELETMALNAVQASLLTQEEKNEMTTAFKAEYAALRAEHSVAL